jgi:hypothetical protein
MHSSPIVKISSWARRAKTDATVRAVAAVALACSTCAVFAPACASRVARTPSVRDDAPAPLAPLSLGPPVDFVFDSLDSRPVSAESTRGKPTLLVFVTTASLPAQAQVDYVVAMAKHDGERVNYAVVALESTANRELVEMYGRALGTPFPLALADAETLVASGPFGDVTAVPTTVLLDRSGRVVWRADGRVAKSVEIRAALRGL